MCGGAFKEAPPLFKIRCWEGGALCGLGRTPGLFLKGLPPPHPQFLPPECPARAAVRGRGFPRSSSCTSHSVSGGPGGRLGKSSVPRQRLSGAGDPNPAPGTASSAPPAQLTPSGPPAPTPPFPAASRAVSGPDVSLASPPPRPRASGQELPPPAPVPRPPAAPNPAPRARRHE